MYGKNFELSFLKNDYTYYNERTVSNKKVFSRILPRTVQGKRISDVINLSILHIRDKNPELGSQLYGETGGVNFFLK